MRALEAIAIALGLGAVAYAIAKSSESKGGGGGGIYVSIPETPMNVEGIIQAFKEGINQLAIGQVNLSEFVRALQSGQITLAKAFLEAQKSYLALIERLTGRRYEPVRLQIQRTEKALSLEEVMRKIREGAVGTWKVNIGGKIAEITSKKVNIPTGSELLNKLKPEQVSASGGGDWLSVIQGFLGELWAPWRMQLARLAEDLKKTSEQAAKELVPRVWHWNPMPVVGQPRLIWRHHHGGGGSGTIHQAVENVKRKLEYTVHTGYKLGGRPWSFHVNLRSGWVAGL